MNDVTTKTDLESISVSSLLKETRNLTEEEQGQFLVDLEFEEKLNEFLTFVIRNVDS